MSDVNQTGLHYTWNQRPKSSVGVVKKIDRFTANIEFIQEYVNCFAIFQPHRISDHNPTMLKMPIRTREKTKPFKFTKLIIHKDGYSDMSKEAWKGDVDDFSIRCRKVQKTQETN